MKSHPFAASLLGLGALAAMGAIAARPEIDMTDEERKAPPPAAPPETPKNLPGETNRQFAARLQAEADQ